MKDFTKSSRKTFTKSSSKAFTEFHKQLTSHSIGVLASVASNRCFGWSFNYSWHHLVTNANCDENWNKKQKFRGTSETRMNFNYFQLLTLSSLYLHMSPHFRETKGLKLGFSTQNGSVQTELCEAVCLIGCFYKNALPVASDTVPNPNNECRA